MAKKANYQETNKDFKTRKLLVVEYRVTLWTNLREVGAWGDNLTRIGTDRNAGLEEEFPLVATIIETNKDFKRIQKSLEILEDKQPQKV